MDKILDCITKEISKAFEEAGYEASLGRATWSNRPDLCEIQCNGAMAGAKIYKKAPIMIAGEVKEKLAGSSIVTDVEAVNPGFLNMNINADFLAQYLGQMAQSEKFGLETGEKKKIIVDYGGPNVAKPLHVGHLRSAVIGQAVKNLCNYMGHETIGDIHLGDWGLQMGLVITEIKERMPQLIYFDENYEGEYPPECPVTVTELEEIYPTASGKSKEDPQYKAAAMEATFKLQSGVRGYRELWKRVLKASVTDMKKIYDSLNVSFELWKGESDVHDIIPGMVQYLKDGGYAYISDGALVVDVKEESDTKEIPPCMILKSDGASLYNTTDLATILDRMNNFKPDRMIYLTDKRQNLYFEQVFRCARKTKIIDETTGLDHIGFGTVNGKDGHAFKTREGGVMRLESLVNEINEKMYAKMSDGRDMSEEEARVTSKQIALAAIKYGDLSNQPAKDYIFDIDKFTSFEGDTGPYILYTIVRIKSILAKYNEQGKNASTAKLTAPDTKQQKELMLEITKFISMMESAYEELAPNRICSYIYELANDFNSFYHETKIMSETDETKQAGYIALLVICKEILEACIGVLGFSAPDRM